MFYPILSIYNKIESRLASCGFLLILNGSLTVNLDIWSKALDLMLVTFSGYFCFFRFDVKMGDCFSSIIFFFKSNTLNWLLYFTAFLNIVKFATSYEDNVFSLFCFLFLIIVYVCKVSYFYFIFLFSYYSPLFFFVRLTISSSIVLFASS